MIKKSMKIFSFLSALFLILLIVPQGAQASSSTLTSDYPKMTAIVHQNISDGGQIGGTYFDRSDNAPDRFRSILATPVPELVAMLLLGFILNGLWGGTRKVRRN